MPLFAYLWRWCLLSMQAAVGSDKRLFSPRETRPEAPPERA